MAQQFPIDNLLIIKFIENNPGISYESRTLLNDWYSSLLSPDDTKNRDTARLLIINLADQSFGHFLYPSGTQKQLLKIFEPLENIARIAISIDEKNKGKIRDHLNHTLRNILLSNYIFHNFFDHDELKIKLLTLSAIFHDIGYPIEKFKKLTSEIVYKTFKECLNSDGKINIEISSPEKLLMLLDVFGNLTIVHEKNGRYSIEEVLVINREIELIYKEVIARAIAGRGLFEAPHFLSSFVLFIRPYILHWKNDVTFWNENIVPIIDICFGIVFHDRKMDITLLEKHFGKIPDLALSLRLADELQEWDRDRKELQFVENVFFTPHKGKTIEFKFLMKHRYQYGKIGHIDHPSPFL